MARTLAVQGDNVNTSIIPLYSTHMMVKNILGFVVLWNFVGTCTEMRDVGDAIEVSNLKVRANLLQVDITNLDTLSNEVIVYFHMLFAWNTSF